MSARLRVRLDGATLHFGETRIANNLLLGCSQAGVIVTGASFPNAAVTLDGNVMQVGGTAIRAGVDGLRILENELVGTTANVLPTASPSSRVWTPGRSTGRW